MGILIEWGETDFFMVPDGGQAIIGRDLHVEVHIPGSKVSRHHAQITHEGGEWILRDLQAANGTFVDGERIATHTIVGPGTILFGGLRGVAVRFTLTGEKPEGQTAPIVGAGRLAKFADADSTHLASLARIILPPHLKIGSHVDNDIVLTEQGVNTFHAAISDNQRGGHDFANLNTTSETFINGLLAGRRRTLRQGDTVMVGQWTRRYTGQALEVVDATGGFTFEADELSFVAGEKTLVDNVSLRLGPRTLTAVVGPSGSGKSTLLSILAAKQHASSGQVLYAGRDLYSNFGELRNRIGFVPQDDLLHLKLKTREALAYAAALRFPRDSWPEDREERISEVLETLGLTERQDLAIEKLSGGQRKRTSVALELLTEPSLLFLDEPTSGLDPGLDRQVMMLLRDLANDGRTVLVVTHSVANLDVCDEVIVMAPGGRLAYQGAPHAVFQAIGAKDWAGVFGVLHHSEGKSWGSKNRTSATRVITSNPPELPNVRQQPWFYQLRVLCSRYLRVIAADRAYSAILVLLPFILAAVGFSTGNASGLGEGPPKDMLLNPQARSLLLVFILGSSFIGIAAAVQELVKEGSIFDRERSIGLNVSAYFVSKIAVLGAIVSVQTLVFISISLAGRGTPAQGAFFSSSYFEIVSAAILLSLASMTIGLLISAIVKTTDVTMPALVLVTMAQVVFSGAVPLRVSGFIDVMGFVNPGYWAMNAFGATTDLNSLAGLGSADNGLYWDSTPANFLVSVLALLVITVAAGAVTRYLLRAQIRHH
jgi:ABC-type multidrug transport system ATPase subunit/pSer/pThr/pTyr-binding forkhead associated (FHA) protein